MRLANNLHRHKSRTSLNFGQIGLLTLELLALACQKKNIFDFVRSVACVTFMKLGDE